MRKIEEKMVNAVRNCKYFCEGNTKVEPTQGAVMVYLHGNLIFKKSRVNGCADAFNMCGWNTPTTRSRLNALGVGVYQKNFEAYRDGKPVPTHGWVTI